MAPATVQALPCIAEESATSAKNAVFETTGFMLDADLRCELLGEALTSNLHLGNLNGIVARRSQLLFLYQCVNCNFDAVALHEAGCHLKTTKKVNVLQGIFKLVWRGLQQNHEGFGIWPGEG